MRQWNVRPLEWLKEGNCLRCTSHALDGDGYPRIRRNGKRLKLCRWILFRKFGNQPPSVVSRHTCGNTWCINPDHIIFGTPTENRYDQGDFTVGEHNGMAKLTVSEVVEIFKDPGKHRDIAVRFGISRSHVTGIKSGAYWARQTLGL